MGILMTSLTRQLPSFVLVSLYILNFNKKEKKNQNKKKTWPHFLALPFRWIIARWNHTARELLPLILLLLTVVSFLHNISVGCRRVHRRRHHRRRRWWALLLALFRPSSSPCHQRKMRQPDNIASKKNIKHLPDLSILRFQRFIGCACGTEFPSFPGSH